jgi:hypothetical protein
MPIILTPALMRERAAEHPLDPPRRRQHALLDFLASKPIQRKSQQVWPSEAGSPRRARGEEGEMSNPLEAAIEAYGLEHWSLLARDLNGASPWES